MVVLQRQDPATEQQKPELPRFSKMQVQATLVKAGAGEGTRVGDWVIGIDSHTDKHSGERDHCIRDLGGTQLLGRHTDAHSGLEPDGDSRDYVRAIIHVHESE